MRSHSGSIAILWDVGPLSPPPLFHRHPPGPCAAPARPSSDKTNSNHPLAKHLGRLHSHFLIVSEFILRWCKFSCHAKLAAPNLHFRICFGISSFRTYTYTFHLVICTPSQEKEKGFSKTSTKHTMCMGINTCRIPNDFLTYMCSYRI